MYAGSCATNCLPPVHVLPRTFTALRRFASLSRLHKTTGLLDDQLMSYSVGGKAGTVAQCIFSNTIALDQRFASPPLRQLGFFVHQHCFLTQLPHAPLAPPWETKSYSSTTLLSSRHSSLVSSNKLRQSVRLQLPSIQTLWQSVVFVTSHFTTKRQCLCVKQSSA